MDGSMFEKSVIAIAIVHEKTMNGILVMYGQTDRHTLSKMHGETMVFPWKIHGKYSMESWYTILFMEICSPCFQGYSLVSMVLPCQEKQGILRSAMLFHAFPMP
jgi:hypothetical protein